MGWKVKISSRVCKQIARLPKKVQIQLGLLLKEMEVFGPIRNSWKSFGPLQKSRNIPQSSFHCHVRRGSPTYVACWRIVNKKSKIIEVYYVGTHEKAPY